jgi:hypothetical protein
MTATPRARLVRQAANAALLALAAAGAFVVAPGVARTPLDRVPTAIVHAPDVVAELPAEALTQVATVTATVTARAAGRHLGFDTHSYPGDRAMRRWKDASPYEWVGYYLPAAPCHASTSWAGKRETLEAMGWGIAVIYVGQQTWDGLAAPPVAQAERRLAREGRACHKAFVTADRGGAEARDAVERTAGEGFAPGTVVFLDIEHMDRTHARMLDYARAWVRGVLADGRYRPGIYVHTRNARDIYEMVRDEYVRAGLAEEPPFWVAGGGRFTPEKRPQQVGHAFAAMWQGILDVHQSWGGVRLPIDVNVAAMPSPSSSAYQLSPSFAMGD